MNAVAEALSNAEFVEAEHPRDGDGKFAASIGSGSATASPAATGSRASTYIANVRSAVRALRAAGLPLEVQRVAVRAMLPGGAAFDTMQGGDGGALANNCGTGAGGFQPGNSCSGGTASVAGVSKEAANALIGKLPKAGRSGRFPQALANAGQPCGESFIASEKECHVGQGDSSQILKFKTRNEGIAYFKALPTEEREFWWAKQTKSKLRAGAPEQPPTKTPAYSEWFNKWVITSGHGVTNDELAIATLNSTPTGNDEKGFKKSEENRIGEKENDARRTAMAETLGFKPRGRMETDGDFSARMGAERARPESAFSPSNPNQTHTLDYKGKAYTVAESAFEGWTMSSHAVPYWISAASKMAGEDFEARNAEFRKTVYPPWIVNADREWFDEAKFEALIRAKDAESKSNGVFIEADMNRYRASLSGFAPYKDEYLKLLDREAVIRDPKSAFRTTKWADQDSSPAYQADGKEMKEIDSRKREIQRMAAGRAEVILSTPSPSQVRGIEAFHNEAVQSFKKDADIFRGVVLKPEIAAQIKASLASNGYFDLPVRRLSSWTERESLAKTFSKHGEGKKSGRDSNETGMVLKAKATKENVWMHPRQPSYLAVIEENRNEGQKFNSGGVDQKEVVIEHKDPYFRITNDNSYFWG